MQKGKLLFLRFAVIGAVLVSSQVVFAHSDWLNPQRGQGIFLELNRPVLKDQYDGVGIWSFFLSGEIEIGRTSNLILELPYITYSEDRITYYGDITSHSESLVGNPYVGLRSSSTDNGFTWEVGGRLPIADKESVNAFIAAAFAHYLRLEAFAPKTVSMRGMFGYRYTSPEGLIVIAEAGPLFDIPTEDRDINDDELLADFSFQIWANPSNVVYFGGGLNGRFWISEDDLSFSDRLVANAIFAAQAQFGQVRPGLHLIVPLSNNYFDVVNVIIGANVAFFFPSGGNGW
jgi:hypothetical protein